MSSSRIAFVGLTGGIGSGKSTALAVLERLGAAVLSSDAVVHELYEGDEVRDAVVRRWGPEVAPDGHVDRSAIAERAFAGDGEREWLEGLIWPLVAGRIVTWRKQVMAREPHPVAAVVEVPLLFEAGMEVAFDATIAIVSDASLAAQRAGERGHAAVHERRARQLDPEEKRVRADYVVINDGSVEDLERELSGVLEKLKE